VSTANWLTLTRVFLSPLFLCVYLWHDWIGIALETAVYALLAIMTILELSDALDGYVARKYGEVTDLGKILDPMADSVARFAIFLSFTQPPVNLPIFYVFALAWRDSVVSTLRTICALNGYALAARISGKIKALIQATSAFLILFMLLAYSHGAIAQQTLVKMSTIFAGIAVFYTLYSVMDYINANKSYIRKILIRRIGREKSDTNF
jgi:CDP-diacylglycerol--glycerol-3-phosphate 3-phosphatidyltransferase